MKQRVAQITEWAWSNNWLSPQQLEASVEALAVLIYNSLPTAKWSSAATKARGLELLENDIRESAKKLSYGQYGSQALRIHPKRKAYLDSLFASEDNFCASFDKALTSKQAS